MAAKTYVAEIVALKFSMLLSTTHDEKTSCLRGLALREPSRKLSDTKREDTVGTKNIDTIVSTLPAFILFEASVIKVSSSIRTKPKLSRIFLLLLAIHHERFFSATCTPTFNAPQQTSARDFLYYSHHAVGRGAHRRFLFASTLASRSSDTHERRLHDDEYG